MSPTEYLDALLTLPGLLGASVSPDGLWVAWSWYRTAPAAEVYVAPTDGSAAPLRLTDSPEDTRIVSWLPDSAGLIVVQDRAGDERDCLYRVDLAHPGKMVPLTDLQPE